MGDGKIWRLLISKSNNVEFKAAIIPAKVMLEFEWVRVKISLLKSNDLKD